MPKNERFFNTVGVCKPEDHYFLPHRLDWEQLIEFIKKNITLFCMLPVKVEKQQPLLNL